MSASLLRLARRHVSAVPSRTTLVSARVFSHTPAQHADPWLLPNTPEHVAKTTSPPDAPAPQPLARPGEDVERTRARLVYQSRKRGTLESDLLLSTFARERLGGMSEAELHEFDKVRAALLVLRAGEGSPCGCCCFCVSLERWTCGGVGDESGADEVRSSWTSRTGTSTTGRRGRRRRLRGGRARACSRSCASMSKTRAKLYGGCPTFRRLRVSLSFCTPFHTGMRHRKFYVIRHVPPSFDHPAFPILEDMHRLANTLGIEVLELEHTVE